MKDNSNSDAFKDIYEPTLIQVTSILKDKRGNFWFTTLNHGVYQKNETSITNFLSHQVLLCILEDKLGNIWVGSWSHGGVYRYDGTSFNHVNGLSDDMIKCMIEDKAGNIWFGTRNHGVDRYNGQSFTNFSEKEGFCSNEVACMLADKNGNLWFGSDVTKGGKKRGDACCYKDKSFKNLTANEALTTKRDWVYTVMSMIEDNSGNLWLGSRAGLLFRYNGESFTDFSSEIK